MKRFLALIGLLTPWLLVYGAQDEPASSRAAALLEEFRTKTTSPGLAVAVGHNGRVVWSEGFGYADLEQRVPVWPSLTRFRIGSVSKPMTAVAIGLLWEQGKLDLDAPVQRYVPNFPEKAQGIITTRLLAGHLAGIRHYRAGEMHSLKHYPSVVSGLEIFREDDLLHPPGTRFHYSSYGWNLISAVVETAAEQEFLNYMTEEVFVPLGMLHTTADQVEDIVLNRTRYYVLEDGQPRNAPPVDNSYKWAGGGFLSTAEDLVRFGFAHLRPALLKPETVNLLWSSQKTVAGEEVGYGIGWRVGTTDQGGPWVGHSGGSVGGATDLRVYPKSQVVVAVISNLSGVRYGDLAEQIHDLFAEEQDRP